MPNSLQLGIGSNYYYAAAAAAAVFQLIKHIYTKWPIQHFHRYSFKYNSTLGAGYRYLATPFSRC